MTVRPELLPACQHRLNACHQSVALQMHIISPDRSQTIIETHVLNRGCACWCASWLKRSAALVHVHLPHLLALAPLYKMFSIAATPLYMIAASQSAPVSTPDRLQGPAACECQNLKDHPSTDMFAKIRLTPACIALGAVHFGFVIVGYCGGLIAHRCHL